MRCGLQCDGGAGTLLGHRENRVMEREEELMEERREEQQHEIWMENQEGRRWGGKE